MTNDNDVPAKYKEIGVKTAGDYNRVFGSIMRGRISGRIAEAIRSQVSLLAASPAFSEGTNVDYAKAADDAATVLDRINGVNGLSATGNNWFMQTRKSMRLDQVLVLLKFFGVAVVPMVLMTGILV